MHDFVLSYSKFLKAGLTSLIRINDVVQYICFKIVKLRIVVTHVDFLSQNKLDIMVYEGLIVINRNAIFRNFGIVSYGHYFTFTQVLNNLIFVRNKINYK